MWIHRLCMPHPGANACKVYTRSTQPSQFLDQDGQPRRPTLIFGNSISVWYRELASDSHLLVGTTETHACGTRPPCCAKDLGVVLGCPKRSGRVIVCVRIPLLIFTHTPEFQRMLAAIHPSCMVRCRQHRDSLDRCCHIELVGCGHIPSRARYEPTVICMCSPTA